MRFSTIASWAFAALATAAPVAQLGLPLVGSGLVPGTSGITGVLGVVAVVEAELGVLSLSRQSSIVSVCAGLGLDIHVATVRELFVALLIQNSGLIVTVEAEVVGIFVGVGLDLYVSPIVVVIAQFGLVVDDPFDNLINKCGLVGTSH
ncbi:hypothetical protein Tdes44962_MAKER04885 [Teratosphaeria destructans]|uniref:Uncharacterized protein n=1 Tax=Teratosphaeria destructans TaxID=418781 RepID=A0A9W7SL38_9PEZI|nr:hypothetical protein Tdes44962_MAKER04885 [Teratosphaeria destructans]